MVGKLYSTTLKLSSKQNDFKLTVRQARGNYVFNDRAGINNYLCKLLLIETVAIVWLVPRTLRLLETHHNASIRPIPLTVPDH